MARPYKRLIITDKLSADIGSSYDLDGPVEEVIEELRAILNKYSDSHDNIRIDVEDNTGHCYECYTSISFLGDREETDKEYSKRVEKLKAEKEKKLLQKKKQELYEKRLLKELRKKYGSK